MVDTNTVKKAFLYKARNAFMIQVKNFFCLHVKANQTIHEKEPSVIDALIRFLPAAKPVNLRLCQLK